MKRLIVAEKPSVAADLARALGLRASGRREGLIEGPELVITWCVGHLVELAEPHEYRPEWKRWSARSLPILPDRFKLRPRPSSLPQWRVVSRQMRRPDVHEVVNACDAGREGELIFRMAYELAGCRLPVLRLWISSLTSEAIRQGFRRLRPGPEFDDLAAAAACRNQADWLVGINATRCATVVAGGLVPESRLLSVGRVQTPTLALIAARDEAIQNFVPEDYFELWADFDHAAVRYRGQWRGPQQETRFPTLAAARSVEASVQGRSGVVEEVARKEVEEKPPLLFDLTSLQRTANRAFGLSAAKTLAAAQSLYERHKVITYPRTDSRFLTPDLVPTLRDRVEATAVGPYAGFAGEILAKPGLPSVSRVVQAGKVKDHHAIVPTAKRANLESLGSDERRVYDLIVRRFLGVFYPAARFLEVIAWTRVDTPAGPAEFERFRSRGRRMLEAGWRVVAGLDDPGKLKRTANADAESGEEPEPDAGAELLNRLREGDRARVAETGVETKQTKPPPRYTDASLLASMEGAGKTIEEEALREAMKDSGLGTPATRAQILETLVERGYVVREGKSLRATDAGRALLEFLPVAELKSAELTGRWEARLARMARGEEAPARFLDDTRAFVVEMTQRLLAAEPPRSVAEASLGPCPRCGKDVVRGRRFYECLDARAGACTTRIPVVLAGQALSGKLVAELLAKGLSGPVSGFKSKAGKKFSAALALGQDGGVTFRFDAPRRSPPGARRARSAVRLRQAGKGPDAVAPGRPSLMDLGAACPECGRGRLISGRKGWGCTRWREGCRFVIWFEISGKRLTPKQARDLASKGRTGWLRGFRSPGGESFRARLVLRPDPESQAPRVVLEREA